MTKQFNRIIILNEFVAPHDANMPMQYTAIFHGCKNGNYYVQECYTFLIFAQNIDCGYTLDPLTEAVLTSTHNLF